MSRLLSCYCTACFSGKPEDFQNKSWVDEWQYHAPGEKSSGKSTANTSEKITAKPGTSTRRTQISQADQEADESTLAPVDGDFVAVRVSSSRKTSRSSLINVYMAEVHEADEDEVGLSYMVRSVLMYKWPEHERSRRSSTSHSVMLLAS